MAALWQYIKQNRLQDSDDRRFIILNSELQEVFGSEERIEFHQIISMLKEHLDDCKPTQLLFEIKRDGNKNEKRFFDMQVQVFSAK